MGEQSKHTPGPWRATKEKDGYFSISGEGWANFARVAVRFLGRKRNNPTGVANVNLILAAPDLLAACKAFIRGMEDTFPGGVSSVREDSPLGRAWRDGIAAVAKAEGGDTC